MYCKVLHRLPGLVRCTQCIQLRRVLEAKSNSFATERKWCLHHAERWRQAHAAELPEARPFRTGTYKTTLCSMGVGKAPLARSVNGARYSLKSFCDPFGGS